MEKRKGAFWVHRGIEDHWLWKKKPFSPGQVWIDMILLANHKETKLPFKNKIVTIKRGEFIRSQRQLAKRWGWNRSKIQRFLVLLENDSMIERKPNRKANHITLCNYTEMQELRTKNEPKVNQKRTGSEPRVNLNKELKNVKKEKKEKDNAHFFEIFWKVWPRKIAKKDAKKAWVKINPNQILLDKILDAVETAKEGWDDPQFIPYPASWLNAERWEDEEPEIKLGASDYETKKILEGLDGRERKRHR